MKKLLLTTLALAAGATAGAAERTDGLSKGTPTVKSISAMAFSPDGVLFLGDSTGGAITAVALDDAKPAGKIDVNFDKLDATLADAMGTQAADVRVTDVKVNPATGRVYVAAARKAGGDPVLFRIDSGLKVTEVPLKGVAFATQALPNASEKQRALAITSMAFLGGKLIVAGLSNEEFASTLRAVSFPFKAADKGTAVEIYHAAHNALETRSPIQTLVPYTADGKDYVLASYTCTPLVRIPVADLKAGEKVKGATVAELGNMNRPLDIIVYTKDKKDYALMANDRRGVMKISLDGIDKAQPITTAVRGGGTAGTAFEKVEALAGVRQLDRLDADHAIVLIEGKDKSLSLKAVDLP